MNLMQIGNVLPTFLLAALILGVRAVERTRIEQCIDGFANITDLDSVCQSSGSATSLVEEVVREYMGKCLEEDLRRDLRITVPNTTLLPALKRHAATFQDLYNITVEFNPVEVEDLADEVRAEAQAELQAFSDGWIVDPSVTGDLAAANALVNLSYFVFQDQGLDWSDVSTFFRTISAYFDKRIIGVPLDGDLLLMYYRRDLFDRYKLPVPVTWDEFAGLAESMNGTDTDGDGVGDLWGVCLDNEPRCKSSWILTAILTPYVQYLGTQQGVYIDPENMKPLINNAAMSHAVQLYLRLFAVQPRPVGCPATNPFFNNGSCLMTINFGDQFKVSAKLHNSSTSGAAPRAINGTALGVSRLPGSTEVLNRTSGKMVPCTGLDVCPYAQQVRLANGNLAWINFAPFSAFGGWTGMVNAHTSKDYQRHAYNFFSHVSKPENSIVDVLDPDSGIDVYRIKQLQTSPENLNLWGDHGYDTNATMSYLSVVGEALGLGNVVLDIRLQTMASLTRDTMGAVADNNTWLQQPPDSVLARGQYELELRLNSSSGVSRGGPGGRSSLQIQYWQLLGYTDGGGPRKDVLPDDDGHAEEADGRGLSTRATVLLAVLIPVGAVLLAAAVGLMVRRRVMGHRNLLYGYIKAPMAGPQTTLLITDIQDSTSLWEALPDVIMDSALKTHHAVVRQALTKHNGYESATEGDSFILAFHTPADTVACAMRIQTGLIAAPWPPQLLQCASAAEVWVAPSCSLQQHSALLDMLGGSCKLKAKGGRLLRLVSSCWGAAAAAGCRPRRTLIRPTPGYLQLPASTAANVSAAAATSTNSKLALLQRPSAAAAAAVSVDAEAGLKHHFESQDGQLQLTASQLGWTSSASGLVDEDGGPAVSTNLSASFEGYLSRGSSHLRDDLAGSGGGLLGRFSVAFANMAPWTRRHQPQLSQQQLTCPFLMMEKSDLRRGKSWFGGATGVAGISAAAVASAASAGGTGSAAGPVSDSSRLLIDHIRSVWLALDPPEPFLAACQPAQQTRLDTSYGAEAGTAVTHRPEKDQRLGWDRRRFIAAPTLGPSGGEIALSTAPAVAAPAPTLAPSQPSDHIHHRAGQSATANNAPLAVSAIAVEVADVISDCGREQMQPALQPAKLEAANLPSCNGDGLLAPAKLPPKIKVSCGGDEQGSQLLLQPSSSSPQPPRQLSQHQVGLYDDAVGAGAGIRRQAAARLVLAFRGLRVRMGIHSGVPEAGDVTYNQAEARYHYSGSGMAIARAVEGAAAGGQVLLSDATFARVRDARGSKRLRDAMLIHAGEHVLDEKLTAQQLYQALPRQLLCRLPLQPPLKAIRTVSAGALEAPVGRVTVAFVSVVGVATLQAWDSEVTRQSLGVFQDVFLAAAAANAAQGAYLVECTGGLLLATFTSAADALVTCLAVQSGLLLADWPPELLEHDMCEEVAIATSQIEGTIVREVLFRGLRVKVGIDCGPARAALNAATGRIAYRGRVMNRAARISAKSSSGQVLCSSTAWQAAAASDAAEGGPAARGLAALSLGQIILKGIGEPVEVLEARFVAPASPRGASTRLGRIVPGSHLSGSLNELSSAATTAGTPPPLLPPPAPMDTTDNTHCSHEVKQRRGSTCASSCAAPAAAAAAEAAAVIDSDLTAGAAATATDAGDVQSLHGGGSFVTQERQQGMLEGNRMFRGDNLSRRSTSHRLLAASAVYSLRASSATSGGSGVHIATAAATPAPTVQVFRVNARTGIAALELPR